MIVIGCLTASDAHQFDKHRGAQAAIHRNALGIDAIDEGDKILVRANLNSFNEALVAAHREFAQGGIKQMCSNIAHAPLRRNGRQIPFGRFKRFKQLD